MKYFLGLDNGGTNTKAVLYTERGEEVGSASIETATKTPRPGFTERDMEEMWGANCAIIRRVIAETGTDPKNIAGIAVCGHGKGLYLWGKANKPAYQGIISTDDRAWEYVQKWKRDGTERAIFDISYQHVMACQPVALLAWLKDHVPAVMNNVQWIFECKDYVRFRLTGEAMAEITDYSGANFINLKTRQYDPELLRLFGLEDLWDALPPLCNSTDRCGCVTEEAAALTGLMAGTPVAGGMFDIDACAIAANVTEEKHVCMIAGTWSINEYPSKTAIRDGSVLMNSLFCNPDYYLIEESSATSAGNLEWFIRSLLPELEHAKDARGENLFDDLNAWVESIQPNEFCPIFLPFLMASNVHPNAKGSFVGITGYHSRKHLVRGIYEGIAFSHRYHLDKLLKTRTTMPESIRLVGGVTNSRVWSQMFADVMQVPVETVAVREAGALGCAITAAVAVGTYGDLNEAASKMTSIKAVFLPDEKNVAAYQRKYALYLKVINALDDVWPEIQQNIEGDNRS
jgi:L-xylulokinase